MCGQKPLNLVRTKTSSREHRRGIARMFGIGLCLQRRDNPIESTLERSRGLELATVKRDDDREQRLRPQLTLPVGKPLAQRIPEPGTEPPAGRGREPSRSGTPRHARTGGPNLTPVGELELGTKR